MAIIITPQIPPKSRPSSPPPITLQKSRCFPGSENQEIPTPNPIICSITLDQKKSMAALLGVAGLAAMSTLVGPAFSAELPMVGSTFQLAEPSNALSLPTWAIHVSSVVEWITAMALVWQYGEKSGYESWKGLSWGMDDWLISTILFRLAYANWKVEVPLLGGAFCACTWHFFYNAESLDVLVALQAALTVIGNATMCIAAFVYTSHHKSTRRIFDILIPTFGISISFYFCSLSQGRVNGGRKEFGDSTVKRPDG